MHFSNIVESVFKSSFQNLDKEYYESYTEVARSSGAVAVGCFIVGSLIYCINLGDCRAVLCRNGVAIDLS